jgi:regulator of replication initiation timing
LTFIKTRAYNKCKTGGKLNNEVIFQQFDVIEKKIERLINERNSLETANGKLQKRLEELESELQNRNEAEKKLETERGLIRSKINSILTKFDNISES